MYPEHSQSVKADKQTARQTSRQAGGHTDKARGDESSGLVGGVETDPLPG